MAAADLVQIAGVGTLVNHAHEEKHASSRETMVKHLQYRAV